MTMYSSGRRPITDHTINHLISFTIKLQRSRERNWGLSESIENAEKKSWHVRIKTEDAIF